MKKTNVIISLILILVVVISLISCGDSSKATMDNGNYAPESEMPDKNEIMTEDDIKDYSKIIKTVTAYGETKVYDECIEKIKTLVTNHNGYVESSNVSGISYGVTNYRRRASFVFRIPAENLDNFKSEISNAINITSINENAKNVSEEYYNLEAIIETLDAEREGLLNILKSLDNSTQYDYWIKITERLSDIEKQIAIYTAQLNNLDNKISYSTFSLTVEEVKEYTEDAPEKFGERISVAIKESWKNFIDNSQDFVVSLVYFVPTLLTLGFIGGGIAAIIIFANKKSNKKK